MQNLFPGTLLHPESALWIFGILRDYSGSDFFVLFYYILKACEGSLVNKREKFVCSSQGQLKLLMGDQAVTEGICQFAQIYHTDKTVRIYDYVYQEVCEDVSISRRVKGVGNDVAVPADEISAVIVKLADLKSTLQKVAGVAVVQCLFRADGIPFSDDDFPVYVKNFIIF